MDKVEEAAAALDAAMVAKFGPAYLLGKLEVLVALHHTEHGLVRPRPRDEALVRRMQRDRPGRYLIHEAG